MDLTKRKERGKRLAERSASQLFFLGKNKFQPSLVAYSDDGVNSNGSGYIKGEEAWTIGTVNIGLEHLPSLQEFQVSPPRDMIDTLLATQELKKSVNVASCCEMLLENLAWRLPLESLPLSGCR